MPECPTGKSLGRVAISLSNHFSISKRNIYVHPVGQIRSITFAVSSLNEGRWPSSRTLGWDAVDAAASGAQGIAGRFAVSDSQARRTNDADAYGKTVWFWHPLLVSSRRRFSLAQPGLTKSFNPPMTVTRRIRRRGERGISRKAIARGMPECFR